MLDAFLFFLIFLKRNDCIDNQEDKLSSIKQQKETRKASTKTGNKKHEETGSKEQAINC